mgnify:CR=1 FL=1
MAAEHLPNGTEKSIKGKKTGRTNRNKPTEKKRGKKDGKKLNRNALYLIGIIVILFIVFLFVRKNDSAVLYRG